jgi:PAS domain S-box-containing protein
LDRPDGKVIIVLCSPNPSYDSDGDFLGGFGVFSDITDLKLSNEQFLKSEERFKFLAENMGDIVWTLDMNLDATYVSPSIEKVLGFTPEERKRQKLEEIVTPASMDRITAMYMEELQRDAVEDVDPDRSLTVEVEYYHRDSSIVWMEHIVKALRDEAGKIVGIYGVSRDITQRKQAEEKIVQANIEWERTFNAVPDLIAILDTQYRILRANKAMAEKLGLTPQEVAGRTCYECVHAQNEPPSFCPHKRLLTDGKEQIIEVFEERLGGDLLVTVSPILDSEGQLVGSVHIARDITERKRSEKALRQEYAFRNAIIDHVAEGLGVCHETTEYPFVKFTIWNERMTEITGYTLEEINRLGWYQTVYPDPELRAKATERMQRMRQGDELRAEEWKITRADGNNRVLSISSSIIESDDGLVHIMALMQNITERKSAQDALQESETRYRLLAYNATDVIWTVDLDNRLTYISPSIMRLVGFTVEEAMGRTMQQAFTPAAFEKAIQIFAEEIEIESAGPDDPARARMVELEMVRKDGTVVPVEGNFTFLRDPADKVIGILAIVRNITERKRAEEMLRESAEKYRILAENSLQGIAILKGVPPVFTYVNRRWTEIFGYTADEVLSFDSNKIWNLVHPEDRPMVRQRNHDRLMGKPVIPVYEFRTIRKDGATRWVEVFASKIPSENDIVMSLATYVDITERKLAEERIITALQEKEILLREIHHRVKNNMQVISSLLYLQATRAESEQVRQALTASQQRVIAMAMIHEILYSSQDFAGIDLSVYLKRLVLYLQEVYNNQADIRIALELDKVELDINQAVPCSLILNELITNAFKHAFPVGSKGAIQIKVYMANDREVVLELSDNGVGLSADQDLSNPSTLGLRLVQGLLKKQLKGSLDVTREEGTTFTLRWPLLDGKGEST